MRDVIKPFVSSRSSAVYIAPGATVRPARSASSARMDHAVGVIAQPKDRQED